jgi:hypothetical protein
MTRTEFLGRVLGAGGIKIEDSDAGAVFRENACCSATNAASARRS